MYEKLKQEVCEANLELVKQQLVIYTWGNVSAIDRDMGIIVIKPSGISYAAMTPDDMVVINLQGHIIEGKHKPSSDTPTHLYLYEAFSDIGGIVHTHSRFATAWAQAGKEIPVLGTTHADYFHGNIPCTRKLSIKEVKGAYEKETGKVIASCFKKTNPNHMPGVIVNNHGPFNWGKDAHDAAHNAKVMEEIAHMAWITLSLNPEAEMDDYLLQKHFNRKHGKDAYYGQ